MECYCEPSDSDEYAEVWDVTWRKARKPHVCCECLETISPGQRYERIFMLFDGTATHFKTCEFCANEYQTFLQRNPDITWMKGEQNLACNIVWEMRSNERKES